jgi:GntR family transcriptional regulator
MLDQLVLHDNGIPIYVQLREQVLAAIGRGALKPGDRLPTMRQVAVALTIDLNTVQRAYAELERDGLIDKIQGRGSFVAQAAKPSRNRAAETTAFANSIAAQAKAQGFSLKDVADALQALHRKSP